MSAALIVFAKVPRPGAVKTRLTPVLTPEEAARLYEAFLRDALAQYRALDVDVRLYLGPPFGEAHHALAPEGVTIHAQVGEGLGQRMENAFADTLEAGYETACVIGTDHPTLPTVFIRQAFRSLKRPQSLCIGPSDDGGYYLLGMHGFYPQVFANMTYSHPRVFADTLARTDRIDASLTVLPHWYDVDTPATLRRMLDDLENPSVEAAHTRQVIDALELHALRRG